MNQKGVSYYYHNNMWIIICELESVLLKMDSKQNITPHGSCVLKESYVSVVYFVIVEQALRQSQCRHSNHQRTVH